GSTGGTTGGTGAAGNGTGGFAAAGSGGKGGKGGGGHGGTMAHLGGSGGEPGEGGAGQGGNGGEAGTPVAGQGGQPTGGQGGEAGVGQAGQAGSGGAGGEGGSTSTAPNLFFSEYVEASGANPDAVEIINKSGAPVNLAGCSISLYPGGSTTPTNFALTGTIANGGVFVFCTAAIGTSCNQLGAAFDLSGDDAVALRCDAQTLDVIGRIGTDPGTQWGNGTVSTRNHTLRRLCSVTHGDSDGTNAFAPANEWAGYAADVVNGLGSSTCG
ncbi:MAG TPA: lamin tail domain-containing protein, partial [Polyangiaceae bacterium]|nr:lamin tail domain-containing protein [Polyangiaceae bacterium]